MPGVYRAPVPPAQQWCDDNGAPLAAGTLQTYLAGTLTPQATFTSASGAVANATTLTLDADGRLAPGVDLWFSGGIAYRFIIKSAAGVTIDDKDNLTGVNDPTFAAGGFGEWLEGPTPTFISANSFSCVGDQRILLHEGRRVRPTVGGVLFYGTIISAAFAAGLTTVTIDSGFLTNQLTALSYGLEPATNLALPDYRLRVFSSSSAAGWAGLDNTAHVIPAAVFTFSGFLLAAAGDKLRFTILAQSNGAAGPTLAFRINGVNLLTTANPIPNAAPCRYVFELDYISPTNAHVTVTGNGENIGTINQGGFGWGSGTHQLDFFQSAVAARHVKIYSVHAERVMTR